MNDRSNHAMDRESAREKERDGNDDAREIRMGKKDDLMNYSQGMTAENIWMGRGKKELKNGT